MTWLFVERLTVIDFSYLDPRRGLVGESWIMDVELEGELDHQGMLFDFALVKKDIKAWIDRSIDHKLVVPGASGAYYQDMRQGAGTLTFRLDSGEHIKHTGPADSVAILNGISLITPDLVGPYLQKKLRSLLPENVKVIKIQLKPEKITDAFYHYSHGLQQHQGNCQRIAHGHRSRIIIDIEGRRDKQWESIWAERLHDSYIATEDHMKPCSLENYVFFKYEAEQGTFSLELPMDNCYLIPTETTVECIAEHIARETARETGKKVSVKAFEGVGKGAVFKAVPQK